MSVPPRQHTVVIIVIVSIIIPVTVTINIKLKINIILRQLDLAGRWVAVVLQTRGREDGVYY